MAEWINRISEWNGLLNGIVWGPYTLLLLLGAGLYFSIATGFLQWRKFGLVMHETLFKFFKPQKDKNAISPVKALSTALAGTMGTGNIAGVATAIMIGGPGAIFWMWVSAFLGMMTKYAEVFLAVRFRRKNSQGQWIGGPMYYMEDGLNAPLLGVIFAVLGLLTSFGIGNVAQVNSISEAMKTSFEIPPVVTGIVVAILAAAVMIGGAKRIYNVAAWIVPLMSVLYIGGSLYVIWQYADQIPGAFVQMIAYAFKPAPAAGGFLGASVSNALRFGVARGVFSNEAGMGSAPIAHAAAETDSPIRQGLWGIFEVFADTIVACTLTALVILATGVCQSGSSGATLTIMAFEKGMGRFGSSFVAISMLFFAFASILGWSYYGEKCLEYLSGTKFLHGSLAKKRKRRGALPKPLRDRNKPKAYEKSARIYKAIFAAVIVLGSVSRLDLVWNISDTLNGLMAIPNMAAIILLGRIVIQTTNKDKQILIKPGKSSLHRSIKKKASMDVS